MFLKKVFICLITLVVSFNLLFISPKQEIKANPLLVGIGIELAMPYVMNAIGFGPGSTATNEDYNNVKGQVLKKMTAEEKAASKWGLNNYTPNPKKSGWGRIGIASSVIAMLMTTASEVMNSQGDEALPVDKVSTTPEYEFKDYYDGNAFGFQVVFVEGSNTVRVQFPENLGGDIHATGRIDSSRDPSDWEITGNNVHYNGDKTRISVNIDLQRISDGATTGTGNEWLPADYANVFAQKQYPTYEEDVLVPDETIIEKPPHIDTSNPEELPDVVYVEVPDPNAYEESLPKTDEGEIDYEEHDKIEEEQQKQMEEVQNDPDAGKVNDPDYENPEPDDAPEHDQWWSWALGPLIDILDLLSTWFNWIQSQFPELFNFIQSILNLLENIWDYLESLMNVLGSLLESLLSDLLTSLGEWLNPLLNAIESILSLLDSLVSSLMNALEVLLEYLFVPSLEPLVVNLPELQADIKAKFPIITVAKEGLEQLQGACTALDDITANLFGMELTVVNFDALKTASEWYKPIVSGLIWVYVFYYSLRKVNAIISNRGGF